MRQRNQLLRRTQLVLLLSAVLCSVAAAPRLAAQESTSQPPGDPEDDRWRLLRADASRFLREHGAEAARLGWGTLALFSVHPKAPRARLDCMGLVPMLGGALVVEIDETSAAVEDAKGRRLTYRKHPAPAARVAVWELSKRAPRNHESPSQIATSRRGSTSTSNASLRAAHRGSATTADHMKVRKDEQ